MVLVVAVMLAACGSEAQDDRRFANEPVATRAATETPAATEVTEPTATSMPLASPETLLTTRGAPDTLYTLSTGDLIAFTPDSDGGSTTTIDLPDERSPLDADASPSGDRVAVLVGPKDGAAGDVSLLIYDRAGEQIETPRTVFDGTAASATPDATAAEDRFSITWSPQGDAVLVAGAEALVNVPISGEPEPIALDGVAGTIRRAVWGPQGTDVALLVAQSDSAQEVLLLRRDGKVKEVPALTTEPGMSIEHLGWLPDGSGLIFLRSQVTDGVPMGGQISIYRFAEDSTTLLATAGQGGPSAAITSVALSPDGRSVAYVISIRDGEQWAFHSLWIRSVKQPLAYQVPVDNATAVTRLWWVDRGLAWRQSISEQPDAPSQILFTSAQVPPTVVFSTQQADPDATPMASLVASPVATPAD